ncbi:hypothetical protein [Xanthobacter flavus]|uniref:hypothetical protein n=1 Tax=Xanthobacter flavus TaxID=281 RepID=UPI0037272685
MLGFGSTLAALAARFAGIPGPQVKEMVQAAAARNQLLPLLTGRGPQRRSRIVRGHHVDRSRYTGAMLRAIRAERGCGRPPKVLAVRRARQQGSASA